MLSEHILSVKYLRGQLLLFSIIDKTAAVLLNPRIAPQGLVKPGSERRAFNALGTFLLLPFGGSLLLRGQAGMVGG